MCPCVSDHKMKASRSVCLFQVGTLVVGYVLAVVFKWTPGMEGYLRAMSVPIWAILIFYLGKSGTIWHRS